MATARPNSSPRLPPRDTAAGTRLRRAAVKDAPAKPPRGSDDDAAYRQYMGHPAKPPRAPKGADVAALAPVLATRAAYEKLMSEDERFDGYDKKEKRAAVSHALKDTKDTPRERLAAKLALAFLTLDVDGDDDQDVEDDGDSDDDGDLD